MEVPVTQFILPRILVFLGFTMTVNLGCTKSEDKTQTPEAQLSDGGSTAKAPDQFTVTVETTKGNFDIEVTRSWAPLGADRFYELVTSSTKWTQFFLF